EVGHILYCNACLVGYGCLVRGNIISWGLITVFHWLPPAGPLDVVLVALCFRLEGKSSNYPIAPLAALAGEAAKVGVLQTDVVGLEINDKHSCCRRGWIHRIAYVS